MGQQKGRWSWSKDLGEVIDELSASVDALQAQLAEPASRQPRDVIHQLARHRARLHVAKLVRERQRRQTEPGVQARNLAIQAAIHAMLAHVLEARAWSASDAEWNMHDEFASTALRSAQSVARIVVSRMKILRHYSPQNRATFDAARDILNAGRVEELPDISALIATSPGSPSIAIESEQASSDADRRASN